MISKKIVREPENDCYRALAMYAGAANHEGEKLLYRWHEGCISDEFDLAMREVEATQDMNQRTKCGKTYHLVVSVHPEDESRVNMETWQEIEKTFAKALGYSEHQRHCGVHTNTNNMHLHVAYNMIHPETFNRHDPYRDYRIRDKVCREIEQRYGLRVDVEQSEEIEQEAPRRENDKARTVEAHTGQQSFDGYVQERKAVLLEGLESAKAWEDVHTLFGRFGLHLVESGAGLAIRDAHSTKAVKASSLDRSCSKGALEKRFGLFRSGRSAERHEQEQFSARPLHRGVERGQLYQEYLAGIEKRKTVLASIADALKQKEDGIKAHWSGRKRKAEGDRMLRTGDKIALLRALTGHERTDLKRAREEAEEQRRQLREEVPYHNWTAFLRMKALAGDEHALDILRSKGQEAEPGAPGGEEQKEKREALQEAIQGVREKFWNERTEIYRQRHLLHSHVMGLQAASFVHQVIEEDELRSGERSPLRGFTWDIDANGIVLIRLPTGGLIRDNGKEIGFSAYDPMAKATVEKLARLKFGKDYRVEQTAFVRTKKVQKDAELER